MFLGWILIHAINPNKRIQESILCGPNFINLKARLLKKKMTFLFLRTSMRNESRSGRRVAISF